MKTTEIRQNLESEILKILAFKKPLEHNEFEQYLRRLKRLGELNCLYALKQKTIHACAHGDVGGFVEEFFSFTTPLLQRAGKEIDLEVVRDRRTEALFSPRLAEIALGCILNIFLRFGDNIDISVFGTSSAVVICAKGNKTQGKTLNSVCINHIAQLHGGRAITCAERKQTQIVLTFPRFPRFQALKLVPCATELCRLCRI